jgi:hypothetical protein
MEIQFAKQVLMLLLLSLSIVSNAQNFEGKIVYVSQMSGKKQSSQAFCDTLTIFIKGNNCKSGHSNPIFSSNTSYVLENKQFYVDERFKKIKFDISDTLGILREKKTDNLLQTKYKEKIKSYQCQKYILEEKNMQGKEYTEFWITNKWTVDQSYSYYLMKGIGIALKVVGDYPSGKMVQIATEITPMKLDDKLFELPDYPIERVDMSKLAKAYLKEN